MSVNEDELARFHAEQAQKQAKLEADKQAFREKEWVELPSEERASQIAREMKADTPLTPSQEPASASQQRAWERQEDHPALVHGNGFTAAEKLSKHAEMMDLSRQSFDMTPSQKAAVMGDISESMDMLSQMLQQSQALRQSQIQQH